MTVWGAIRGRPAGRLAVAIEMILVCIGGGSALTYALARTELGQPLAMMIGTGLGIVLAGFYIRALHLDG